ncbi:hypothetical protein [Pedobacter sp. Leaf176]|uniref:hypothetical protein n=1 Tax=Pedobacter sp. Leaf176 TaxID=1736286 RepID=UPI0018D22166|nr:hypothetical protein [Pedobacter sp. Leaf176]
MKSSSYTGGQDSVILVWDLKTLKKRIVRNWYDLDTSYKLAPAWVSLVEMAN